VRTRVYMYVVQVLCVVCVGDCVYCMFACVNVCVYVGGNIHVYTRMLCKCCALCVWGIVCIA